MTGLDILHAVICGVVAVTLLVGLILAALWRMGFFSPLEAHEHEHWYDRDDG